MGELFKYGMLKPPIMFVCLTRLLEQKDDESLVFLCKLLAESGKKLEVDIVSFYLRRMSITFFLNGATTICI